MNKHWLDEVLEKSQERMNILPTWLREYAIRQELQRRAEVETHYMSIWEEQKKLLEDNLAEVKARNPEHVNRHVLEAIEHREANMKEFIVTISTEKEYVITASNAFNAALEAERLLWKDIEEKNPPLFSYSMYTTHLVDGEEDFQHHATFDSDELDPNNYD